MRKSIQASSAKYISGWGYLTDIGTASIQFVPIIWTASYTQFGLINPANCYSPPFMREGDSVVGVPEALSSGGRGYK